MNYQNQFKNKKKEVKNKHFFNAGSRLRFWIVSFILYSAIYNGTSGRGYEITSDATINALFDMLIIILFIITCIDRADACGKTRLWAIVMLVPFLNLIGFYYLGFTPSKDIKN